MKRTISPLLLAFLACGFAACAHESSSSSAAATPSAATIKAFDRDGKPVECRVSSGQPHAADRVPVCPPIAPDTEFSDACTRGGFQAVTCNDCFPSCTGDVSAALRTKTPPGSR